MIVTTTNGTQRIYEQHLPSSVQVLAVQSNGPLSARNILEALSKVSHSEMILVEGGPQLMGDLL